MEKRLSYKYSKQREALFALLCSTKTHPTAAWLYDKLKKDFPHLSQGTVYRNLNILAEQKRIKVITVDGTFAHFDADMSVHNHVICTRCGRVDDAFMPTDAHCEQAAEAASGYRISSHRFDFFGLCPDCIREEEKTQEGIVNE